MHNVEGEEQLTYNNLVARYQLPDEELIQTCMEEVERVLVSVRRTALQSGYEQHERVTKVAIFLWTCSMFSVSHMSQHNIQDSNSF